jgi:hypothetical protein
VLLSLIITIPPYANGQYGWDDLEQDCWYTSTEKKDRLAWQIATQIVWMALIVIAELFAVFRVFLYMLRHHMKFKRCFKPTDLSEELGHNTYHLPHGETMTRQTTLNNRASVVPPQMSSQVIYSQKYRSIIIRIGLYPLISCLINFLSVATILHSTLSNGINDQTDYNVLLLSDFLYGCRPIIYALLAATDPALIRGVKTLYINLRRGPIASRVTSSRKKRKLHHGNPVSVQVELSIISDGPVDLPPTLHLMNRKPNDAGQLWSPTSKGVGGEAVRDPRKPCPWDLERDTGIDACPSRAGSSSRYPLRGESQSSSDDTVGSCTERDWFKKHL